MSSSASPASVKEGKSAVVGFTEPRAFVDDALLANGFEVEKAAGAGYKLLCVAKGWVDMYATSKGSTYKWDSCAGHAILNALGGGCFDMAQIRNGGKQVGSFFRGNIVVNFFKKLGFFSSRFHCHMTNRAMEAKGLNSGGTLAVFWQSKASRMWKSFFQ